ncbi:RNA-processing protein, HAT helix [Artemisia annua]|uniref:RNA-processing protein, HAT helix n=1 Tax=Artemisia annua TaxID=35608 RepID=A0A2U1MLS5_ARTAN|nr:RNA-processing protein, HAT helix [Artemisia annua]
MAIRVVYFFDSKTNALKPPDNIKAISSAYKSFLSWFPLCHGYWKKYEDHMVRLCKVEKAVEVYEEAVQSCFWVKSVDLKNRLYCKIIFTLLQDNIKAISSAYKSFLSWFPLCHGYWKKYEDHMVRLCKVEKAVEVYEEAVQSTTYSIGLCFKEFADFVEEDMSCASGNLELHAAYSNI